MAFPVAGVSIAAISLIPALIASSQKQKLKELKECKKFPLNSVPNNIGYYWLRGSLKCKDVIQIDINNGNFVVTQNFGIMRYEIDRCIESRHITKHKIEDKIENDKKSNQERKEGERRESMNMNENKKFKEEKRSHWIKSFENMHKSPIQYASILKINDININQFKDLFILDKQYEIFTDSPYLNNNNNNNNNQNIFNLSLNINTMNNDENDIIGEQERKTIGYKHKWFGVNIDDTYTVIGYWDGNQFEKGDKINIVSKKGYYEIVKGYENGIWWAQVLSVAGLLISGGVGIYETNLFSKL